MGLFVGPFACGVHSKTSQWLCLRADIHSLGGAWCTARTLRLDHCGDLLMPLLWSLSFRGSRSWILGSVGNWRCAQCAVTDTSRRAATPPRGAPAPRDAPLPFRLAWRRPVGVVLSAPRRARAIPAPQYRHNRHDAVRQALRNHVMGRLNISMLMEWSRLLP